jgi:hypothetical protein
MLCKRRFSDWCARLVADLLFAILEFRYQNGPELTWQSGPKEPRIIVVGLAIVNGGTVPPQVVTVLAKQLLNA